MSGGGGSRTRTCLQVFWGDRAATTGGGTKTACGALRLDAQGDAVPHFNTNKASRRLADVFIFLSCVRIETGWPGPGVAAREDGAR
jgi:hypothetical protein